MLCLLPRHPFVLALSTAYGVSILCDTFFQRHGALGCLSSSKLWWSCNGSARSTFPAGCNLDSAWYTRRVHARCCCILQEGGTIDLIFKQNHWP